MPTKPTERAFTLNPPRTFNRFMMFNRFSIIVESEILIARLGLVIEETNVLDAFEFSILKDDVAFFKDNIFVNYIQKLGDLPHSEIKPFRGNLQINFCADVNFLSASFTGNSGEIRLGYFSKTEMADLAKSTPPNEKNLAIDVLPVCVLRSPVAVHAAFFIDLFTRI
jgi:hypothetical protein